MSDVVTPGDVSVEPIVVDGAKPEAKDGVKPDEQLGDAGKKAIESERTARKAAEKQVAEQLAKLKEYEDRDKTVEEKSAQRLAEAEKRATDVEARATRAEVAAATTVPVEILSGPKSSSAEDVQAFAVTVAEYVTAASNKIPNGPVIPGQGRQPTNQVPVSADDWLRSMARK